MRSFRRPARTARRIVPHQVARAFFVTAVLAIPGGLSAQTENPAEPAEPLRPSVESQRQNPDGFLFRAPMVRIGMRAGFNFARAGSGVFDLATDELTLDQNDFGGFTIAGDLALRALDQVDLVFGAAFMSSTARSEFREWEDQDGLPITQRTTFSQVPLTAMARMYLTPRGQQIGRFAWVPTRFAAYVGGGGGAIYYKFTQNGSFVDFVDLSIFDATLESYGWAPVAIVNAGADYTLNARATLNADIRYQFASATMNGNFLDIEDDIDLNGLQLTVGVHFRF
jgi:outer membrane protein W